MVTITLKNQRNLNTGGTVKFRESKLAHEYLDSLWGIEVGGAAHNSFNLPHCLNVDYTDEDTAFKLGEVQLCGEKMKVDIIADGADLPFKDETLDYVISSHVIEHFFDPIATIKEWLRVIKPGGYIFIIAPKKDDDPQETRPYTELSELIERHKGSIKPKDVVMGHEVSQVTGLPLNDKAHWSVWDLEHFLPICQHMGLDVVESLESDDKVGNGFCVVIKK